jgi:FkbM family methyltransferase
MKGRVVWCDEPHVVRQLPLRYRACAAYFRVVRRVQPRHITDKGHVVGGSFLVRSVAWASARLGMTNRLVLRVNGTALACDMSEARTLLIIEEARGHSWQEEFFRSILRPGDTYLDIGANGGGLTALACQIVHTHGAVFAVEPQPHLAALVRQTLELNDVEGRVFEVAAGDRDGVATLVVPMRRSGNATLSMSGQGRRVSVAVNRIDDLVREMGGRDVTLLKLDVEGHELAALKGADALLRTSRPTIVFELNLEAQAAARQSAHELLSWLEERGYTFAEVNDPGVQLKAAGVALRGSRDLIAYPA